ncbi:MAG: hypothetical protein LC804_07365 [Acidobacteria bacterium]|nr:hypothetical protein [Acidobacteriota bacterium]
MLAKHRWLTLVGGFAMTVAIAIGAVAFEVISDLLNPALPFPDGHRVVAVMYVATKAGRADDRLLHAFSAWRGRVATLEYVGAFLDAHHNLVAPDAPPEPIHVAEITASAFDIAQTPPMLGRYSSAIGSAIPLTSRISTLVAFALPPLLRYDGKASLA